MLRDLTVQNYRCFEYFQINGLAQVNLFVGNNNSGKTSLLEAIYLLFADNKYNSLVKILLNRGEVINNSFIFKKMAESTQKSFYVENNIKFIHIEPINNIFTNYKLNNDYKININGTTNGLKNNHFTLKFSLAYIPYANRNCLAIYHKDQTGKDTRTEFEIDLSNHLNISQNIAIDVNQNNDIYLSGKKEELDLMIRFWNDIYLTEKEDKVVQAVQIIDSKVERIGFYQNPLYNTVRLKVKGLERPIAISNMGEGMYRILVLAMSLVTAENGVLLVDEIETGLHYEAQTDMWRLILETAKELNVQVFATTHSWDCIAAYQEAISQVEDQSIGKLFRLDSKYGKMRAVEYDAEDLEVVTREGIEVR